MAHITPANRRLIVLDFRVLTGQNGLRPRVNDVLGYLYDEVGDRLVIIAEGYTREVEALFALPGAATAGIDEIPIIVGTRTTELGDLGIIPDNVPESVRIDGCERPVYLRRPWLYDRLRTLMERRSLMWCDLIIIGTEYESVLALPGHCGARIGLMESANTAEWERRATLATRGGRVFDTMDDLAAFVLSE